MRFIKNSARNSCPRIRICGPQQIALTRNSPQRSRGLFVERRCYRRDRNAFERRRCDHCARRHARLWRNTAIRRSDRHSVEVRRCEVIRRRDSGFCGAHVDSRRSTDRREYLWRERLRGESSLSSRVFCAQSNRTTHGGKHADPLGESGKRRAVARGQRYRLALLHAQLSSLRK